MGVDGAKPMNPANVPSNRLVTTLHGPFSPRRPSYVYIWFFQLKAGRGSDELRKPRPLVIGETGLVRIYVGRTAFFPFRLHTDFSGGFMHG